MPSLMNRTDPSPRRAFTPPVCALRGGTIPGPQSCAPPGQQSPPALGHRQFGGADVFRADCAPGYHRGRVPLLDLMPIGLFRALLPMLSSSACVGKSLFTTELNGAFPA